MEESAREFQQALLSLDRVKSKQLLAQLMNVAQLTNGSPAFEVVETTIVPVLESIGADWEHGKIALSQVFMSSRICEELMDSMLPASNPNMQDQPNTALAVLEDHHLLGKKIVCSMLRSSGVGLLDYGRMSVDALVNRVAEDKIEILLISTLMLPSALKIKEVRAGLNKVDSGIKIVVGGAPFRFDTELWKEVGADAMGKNAGEALNIINQLAGGIS